MPSPLETRFRRWLIDKLKVTRWASSETVNAELARRLGVQLEVLLAAQAELDQENRAAGRPLTQLGRPTIASSPAARKAQLTLQLPQVVYARWTTAARDRNLSRASLLRSAVHTFLLQPEPPYHPPTSGWVIDGVLQPLPWEPEKAIKGKGWWPYWVNASVTRGAKEALTRRARATGCSEFALLRSIMLDVMSGQLQHVIYLTSHTGMWDDPDKYLTMEPAAWTRKT
jgi:hypothetical protein